MARPMRNNSEVGDLVYDPFVGSGTSIIAAERSDRSCFAIELEPRYVDLAVSRWEKYTRHRARLEDGDSFAEVTRKRTAAGGGSEAAGQ
jgi:DNA modification methylase